MSDDQGAPDASGQPEPGDVELPKTDTRGFWVGLGILLAAAIVYALFGSPSSNAGMTAAASLTIIGGAAVAIERSIEAVWGAVDGNGRWGGWWPLTKVSARIRAIEEPANALIGEPLEAMQQALATALAGVDPTEAAAKRIRAELELLNREIPRLTAKVENAAKELAPGSPRLQIVHDAATQATAVYAQAATLVGSGADRALATIDVYARQVEQLEDIIESFSENPARKMASLLMGMIVGVAVAGFLGLNVFLAAGAAAQDTPAETGATTEDAPAAADGPAEDAPMGGRGGIILTGLIIGLGANPTHEVIKALKNRKERDAAGTNAAATSRAGTATAAAGGGGPTAGTYQLYNSRLPEAQADVDVPTPLPAAYLQPRNFRPTA